ncbi:MAG: J domain-containing protein [Acidimicrobiales bacterium]|nr:J domain-containing protein [Acidimicrobiales bacterium]
MILAELEFFHSRPMAPTRRLALGRCDLPADPAPGEAGVLLAGVAARFGGQIHPQLFDEMLELADDLAVGRRVTQPRLRHRLQQDRVGLDCSRHRLRRVESRLVYDLETEQGTAEQHILGALYAAAQLPREARRSVFGYIGMGLKWRGRIGPSLIAHLAGGELLSLSAQADPHAWALETLGFGAEITPPERAAVKKQFRLLMRAAHPDHGAADDGAAQRIAELSEARRILMA